MSLWVLAVLFLVSTSLALYSAMSLRSSGDRTELFKSGAIFKASAEWAADIFRHDASPGEDAPGEPWLGHIAVPEKWSRDLTLMSQDEESKMNLNTASGSALMELFGILVSEEKSLLDAEKTVRAIIDYRAHKPFEHVEELATIGVSPADQVMLKSFVTAYSANDASPRVNVNTASLEVLEAMVRSLSETAGPVRDMLFQVLRRFREGSGAFGPDDLAPDRFASKLGLPRTPEMDAAVASLAVLFTTDSSVIRLEMFYRKRRMAEAVLEPTAGETRILFWHEAKMGKRGA
jgi:type II secretory pathway component PulK